MSITSIISCTFLIGLIILPAVLNGQPVLYPDSVGYYHAGYAALKHVNLFFPHATAPALSANNTLAAEHSDGISTARSVYYGAVYALSYQIGGPWVLPVLQLAIIVGSISLALRRLVAFVQPERTIVLLAIVSISGSAFFAFTIMPDIFAGLMILALAMILSYSRKMEPCEYIFWLSVALLSCLFHRGTLAIFAVMVIGATPFMIRDRRREAISLITVAIVALTAHAAVDISVKRLTGTWPVETPFALARMVGDGTAEKYLALACPTRHLFTCNYLPRMPMTEIEFLWGRDPRKSVMGTASPAARLHVAKEASNIAKETFIHFPSLQIVRSMENTGRQFFDVGVRTFSQTPHGDIDAIPEYRPALVAYKFSGISNGTMPLDVFSTLMTVVFYLSLIAIGVLAWKNRIRRAASSALLFAGVLSAGLIVNAAVCGALSGVFDRYQGRVVWIAPLAAIALWSALQEHVRTSPNQSVEAALHPVRS